MSQPDIEIYVKNTNAKEIQSWLDNVFQDTRITALNDETLEKGLMIKGYVFKECQGTNQSIPIVITPKAAGKAFTSIWFQSDQTGWQHDLECAESFIAMSENEVRCSSATWTEGEAEDEEMWWCLKGGEKTLVRWG